MAASTPLHPSENRGYRELYALSRGLARHWSRLALHAPDAATSRALTDGVDKGRRLLAELPGLVQKNDLYGGPAALGLGGRFADLHNGAVDRFLERGQALRLAVLEARHLVVLTTYLAHVAESRGAEERAAFCRRWESELRSVAEQVEHAVVALGDDPDGAIEPLDDSPVGRAAQRVTYAIGAAGEWVDRQVARRSGPA